MRVLFKLDALTPIFYSQLSNFRNEVKGHEIEDEPNGSNPYLHEEMNFEIRCYHDF